MKKIILLSAALVAGITLSAAIAQQEGHMNHGQMDHSQMGHGAMSMGTPKGDQGPSSKAFAEANAAMHSGMDIEFTGNADLDFVRGMIPHHEGAVAMARIVLEHGADTELKKLAEGIIAAQESEIAFMKGWLEKNAPK